MILIVDLEMRIMELAGQGFECSQIMAVLALESEGRENADVVRAMSGLTGGMGRSGGTCGCLTGGACVLGLFLGQGEEDEIAHGSQRKIIKEYVTWFAEQVAETYGGNTCQDIIGGDYSQCMKVCLPIIMTSFEKTMELLTEHEIL